MHLLHSPPRSAPEGRQHSVWSGGGGGSLLVKTKTTPVGLRDLASLKKRISVQGLCHSSTEHYH